MFYIDVIIYPCPDPDAALANLCKHKMSKDYHCSKFTKPKNGPIRIFVMHIIFDKEAVKLLFYFFKSWYINDYRFNFLCCINMGTYSDHHYYAVC